MWLPALAGGRVALPKMALTGNGKATKEEMVTAARRTMGWRVDTHHEADACAGGAVAYERLWPKARAA